MVSSKKCADGPGFSTRLIRVMRGAGQFVSNERHPSISRYLFS